MLVGAAKEVSAGSVGHQRSRIVTAVQQPWIGRARPWVSSQASAPTQLARRFCIPWLSGGLAGVGALSVEIARWGERERVPKRWLFRWGMR